MAEINEVRMESGALGKNACFAQPTHGLQLMDGRLQQAWLVIQYGEVNEELKRYIEWRDVPTLSNGQL
jgi:hypothetical protein